jgi:hypothetical protein
MAQRQDVAHGTSSHGPFKVSLSNLKLGLFLRYRKLGQMLEDIAIQYLFHFVVSINLILLSSEDRWLRPINVSVRQGRGRDIPLSVIQQNCSA